MPPVRQGLGARFADQQPHRPAKTNKGKKSKENKKKRKKGSWACNHCRKQKHTCSGGVPNTEIACTVCVKYETTNPGHECTWSLSVGKAAAAAVAARAAGAADAADPGSSSSTETLISPLTSSSNLASTSAPPGLGATVARPRAKRRRKSPSVEENEEEQEFEDDGVDKKGCEPSSSNSESFAPSLPLSSSPVGLFPNVTSVPAIQFTILSEDLYPPNRPHSNPSNGSNLDNHFLLPEFSVAEAESEIGMVLSRDRSSAQTSTHAGAYDSGPSKQWDTDPSMPTYGLGIYDGLRSGLCVNGMADPFDNEVTEFDGAFDFEGESPVFVDDSLDYYNLAKAAARKNRLVQTSDGNDCFS